MNLLVGGLCPSLFGHITLACKFISIAFVIYSGLGLRLKHKQDGSVGSSFFVYIRTPPPCIMGIVATCKASSLATYDIL
ncbi:hypothetical protein VNO77_23607 [Canavalia gladiata]|uniref:Uncharacterized protein n=1 Tax=Canavalia gladiata TaxID=3824 RepID=A0AAN9L9Y6_CANGL